MKTEQEQIEAMTKDEIKKALECCEKYAYCKDCPCSAYCTHDLHNNALALITKQEKEIERLRTTLGQCNAELNSALESLKSQCREIGELKAGVKQAQIDVLNKIKNCRDATDSDCYPYLERIVNKLIKEVE